MATGHQKRQIWFCCGCQTWFASREASSRFEASRQSIWKIFQRKGEIRWQTAIQAVAEYEFVVSNKSAPCFSAPPHSRLRNSIKTSDASNNVLQRSATRWNAGNRVVTVQQQRRQRRQLKRNWSPLLFPTEPTTKATCAWTAHAINTFLCDISFKSHTLSTNLSWYILWTAALTHNVL